jgi:molybdenum cofactor cytidylyltransferase
VELRISAVLLAAGLSRRMGEDKLLLLYQGKTLLQHAVDLLSALPVYEKLIVTTEARAKQLEVPFGMRVLINDNPKDGQSVTVHLGVKNATGSHFFFITADQPGLTAPALMPLIELAGKNPDKIIFPSIYEKPNSPTIFPAGFRDELLLLSGDTGGRFIRDADPEKCLSFNPELPELFFDIDDAGDYAELEMRN